ncbi:hypothetical protein ES703_38801 [subsurface metagenome]
MKVRNIITREIFEAEFSTDHAASSYGQPILVLETGEAVDQIFYEILEYTSSRKPDDKPNTS